MNQAHLLDEELLLAYYKEGAPAEALEHLTHCADCSARLASLGHVLQAIEAPIAPEPPLSFEQEMWARVDQRLSQRAPHSFGTWRWRTLGRAAAPAAVPVRRLFFARRAPPVETAVPTPPSSHPSPEKHQQ